MSCGGGCTMYNSGVDLGYSSGYSSGISAPPVGGSGGDWLDWGWDTVSGWIGGGDSAGDVGGNYGSGSWQEHYAKQWTGAACTGAPPAHALVEAVKIDPNGFSSKFLGRLATGNEGHAPTIADLLHVENARLTVHAIMGGEDCQNKRYPNMPAEFKAWLSATLQAGHDAWDGGVGDDGTSDPGDSSGSSGSWWGGVWDWLQGAVDVDVDVGTPNVGQQPRVLGLTPGQLAVWALLLAAAFFLMRRGG